MQPTIKNLWNGNIAPCERCGAHHPQIKRLHALIEETRESLSKDLPVAQMEALRKYVEYSDEYLLHMLELAFCDGFSLGSRLMMEVLQ